MFVPYSLSIADACRSIGIGRTKLYELISEGRLETVKIGRRTLILTRSVEALVCPHVEASDDQA